MLCWESFPEWRAGECCGLSISRSSKSGGFHGKHRERPRRLPSHRTMNQTNDTELGVLGKRLSKWLFLFTSVVFAAILALLYGYIVINLDQLGDHGMVMHVHCPDCSGLIAMWDQVKSSEPDSVRCGDCGEFVQESLAFIGVLEGAVMGAAVPIALAIISSILAKAWKCLLGTGVAFLVFYGLLELGTSLLVFNYAELSVS